MKEHLQQLEQFENKVAITFKDKTILFKAFVHRSFLNEQRGKGYEHNERLEFLGDAVLELIITDFLFNKFPNEDEGVLTAYRAALVNTDSLAQTAAELQMDDYLQMSKGERMDTVKGRMHILANTFESFVGAVYLDQGYETARQFVSDNLFKKIDVIIEKKLFKDAKSYFQEIAQEKEKTTPHYELIAHEGPDHDKQFVMALCLDNVEIARGSGPSKQKAETAAARAGLEAKGWL